MTNVMNLGGRLIGRFRAVWLSEPLPENGGERGGRNALIRKLNQSTGPLTVEVYSLDCCKPPRCVVRIPGYVDGFGVHQFAWLRGEDE